MVYPGISIGVDRLGDLCSLLYGGVARSSYIKVFSLPESHVIARAISPTSILATVTALAASGCITQEDSATSVGDEPIGAITHIAGDLYEAYETGGGGGSHNTVFLVTSDGIILSDPIRVEFAEWLKMELSERFGQAVKYVIYSHHHPDHASGGTVFADTATFVGHEQTTIDLNASLPSNAADLDVNGNGLLERSEATGLAYPQNFDRYDLNGDDTLTGAEINAETPRPELVYSDEMTITLGGSSVELMHPGPAHSDDMSVLYFPEERAAFAVDFLHVKRFPVTLGGYPVAQYVDAIARVETLDFDILIPGHGDIGTKNDLVLFLDFLRALEAAVAAGIDEGKTVEELSETVSIPGYEDWLLYDARRVTLVTETYALLTGQ